MPSRGIPLGLRYLAHLNHLRHQVGRLIRRAAFLVLVAALDHAGSGLWLLSCWPWPSCWAREPRDRLRICTFSFRMSERSARHRPRFPAIDWGETNGSPSIRTQPRTRRGKRNARKSRNGPTTKASMSLLMTLQLKPPRAMGWLVAPIHKSAKASRETLTILCLQAVWRPVSSGSLRNQNSRQRLHRLILHLKNSRPPATQVVSHSRCSRLAATLTQFS